MNLTQLTASLVAFLTGDTVSRDVIADHLEEAGHGEAAANMRRALLSDAKMARALHKVKDLLKLMSQFGVFDQAAELLPGGPDEANALYDLVVEALKVDVRKTYLVHIVQDDEGDIDSYTVVRAADHDAAARLALDDGDYVAFVVDSEIDLNVVAIELVEDANGVLAHGPDLRYFAYRDAAGAFQLDTVD